jgi:hypothetical protein
MTLCIRSRRSVANLPVIIVVLPDPAVVALAAADCSCCADAGAGSSSAERAAPFIIVRRSIPEMPFMSSSLAERDPN